MRRFMAGGVSSALALILSACGGGGGSQGVESTPAPPPPMGASAALPTPMPTPATTPTSENLDTYEYRRSSAAVGANAIGAWQQGATGRGITIGFVDTGLDPNLSDFAGRIDFRSTDVAGSRAMSDSWGHGTAVAGIAAGARNDWGIQGIAYEATIFMARADQGCPNNCTFDTDDVAQGIDAARQSGAKVINLSIGGGASSAIANAVKRAADAGIVIVVAAGNEGTQPSGLAQQLASLAPSNVIIVGALGTTNADGSVNYDLPGKWTTPAAGSLGSFLTAPGWLNGGTSATSATGYDLFSGTSFSAPVVAGALALLAQAFPTLTAQQLVTLLYVTADDLGIAGADSTYGRGRLNIGRAFQPVGSLRMANNDQPLAPDQGAVLPAAAGDAAQQAFLAAVILDGFNRAFEINLASSIRQAREASPLAQSMVTGNQSVTTRAGPISVAMTVADPQIHGSGVQQLALTSKERRATRLLAASAIAAIGNRGRMAMGFGVGSASLRQQLSGTPASAALMMGPANDGVGFGTSDIRSTAFAHQTGRLSLAVSGESGEVSRRARVGGLPDYSLLSVSVGYRALHGDARMTVSRVTEAQTFLGGSLPSLMGDAGSQTYFADVDFSRTLGRFWTLSAAYRRGWTQSSAGQFTTSAFSADITKIGFLASRDQLAFRVSQPLRIEGGGLELLLPSSWNYSTKSSTSALRRLALSPSGRELRAELGYFTPIPGGWMSLNAFGRRAPGHDNSAGADLGISVRIRTSLGG